MPRTNPPTAPRQIIVLRLFTSSPSNRTPRLPDPRSGIPLDSGHPVGRRRTRHYDQLIQPYAGSNDQGEMPETRDSLRG